MSKLFPILCLFLIYSCNKSKSNEEQKAKKNERVFKQDTTNSTPNISIKGTNNCDSVPFLTYSNKSYPYATGGGSDSLQLMRGFYLHKISKEKYLLDYNQTAYELKGKLSRSYKFSLKDTLTLNSFTSCELQPIAYRSNKVLSSVKLSNRKKHIDLYIEAERERIAKLTFINPFSQTDSTLILHRK